MTGKFDSLLDEDEVAVPRKRGRPKGSKNNPAITEARLQKSLERPETNHKVAEQEMGDLLNGVTIQSLCAIFRLSRTAVVNRLKDCPLRSSNTAGIRKYDLATAAQYLVDPRVSLEEFISELKPEQLPERTRESFWNAKRKELLYRRDAGELWPTEAVHAVFAETMKSFRKANQLWADTVEEETGLTEEQRMLVLKLADSALDEVNKQLNVQAMENATYSYEKQLDDQTEAEN